MRWRSQRPPAPAFENLNLLKRCRQPSSVGPAAAHLLPLVCFGELGSPGGRGVVFVGFGAEEISEGGGEGSSRPPAPGEEQGAVIGQGSRGIRSQSKAGFLNMSRRHGIRQKILPSYGGAVRRHDAMSKEVGVLTSSAWRKPSLTPMAIAFPSGCCMLRSCLD